MKHQIMATQRRRQHRRGGHLHRIEFVGEQRRHRHAGGHRQDLDIETFFSDGAGFLGHPERRHGYGIAQVGDAQRAAYRRRHDFRPGSADHCGANHQVDRPAVLEVTIGRYFEYRALRSATTIAFWRFPA